MIFSNETKVKDIALSNSEAKTSTGGGWAGLLLWRRQVASRGVPRCGCLVGRNTEPLAGKQQRQQA